MAAASQTLQGVRKNPLDRCGKVHAYAARPGGDFPLGICPQWANPHQQRGIRVCICSGSEMETVQRRSAPGQQARSGALSLMLNSHFERDLYHIDSSI